MSAITHQQNVHFLTTLCIINAIIHTGNTIAVASTGGGSGGSESGDALRKSIDELTKVLLPQTEESLAKKVEHVKKLMEEETSRGAFKVKAVGETKQPGRVRLRRKPEM